MDPVDNRRILDAFIKGNVDFVVIGGVAMILMKRAPGRDKDLGHIRHLEALKKILAEQ